MPSVPGTRGLTSDRSPLEGCTKESTMRQRILLSGTAACALTFAAATPAMAVTEDDVATFAVLHAIADTPVDVYVDGELTVDDFQPGQLAGPLELAAGDYTIALTAADAADDSAPLLAPFDVDLVAGGDYTTAAFTDAAGAPTATVFENDTTPLAAGQGRLAVRHLAVAPAVDLLLDGAPVVVALANPDEEVLELPVGAVSAVLAPTGSTDPIADPFDVDLVEGATTVVYAWGSAQDETVDVAMQTVDTDQMVPSGVPTGELGLAADEQSAVPWVVAASAALLVGAAGAALVGVRRRAVVPVRR